MHTVKAAVLVLNAGSSSIKFSLFAAQQLPEPKTLLCYGQVDGVGHNAQFRVHDARDREIHNVQLGPLTDHAHALEHLLNWTASAYKEYSLKAIGHRVVHGGASYLQPQCIDDEVITKLEALIPLAPLHQPHHIAAIKAISSRYPHTLQVACFDTAFHHTQPDIATHFALPRAITEASVRRYGFHGLSYEYIAQTLPDLIGKERALGRVVVAHLGSGASMCALLNGRSVATTMGFTALDGLPMGRRCGALDPGVVLYLLQEKKLSAEQVSNMLYQESGLYGVSGISDDMRDLLNSQDVHAQEAVELFVYRIQRELGSLVAAVGGLDVLVFTGGIGEHAVQIRAAVCRAAAWIGIVVDDHANANIANQPACISTPQSAVAVWTIPTNEDLMIARHTWQLSENTDYSKTSP